MGSRVFRTAALQRQQVFDRATANAMWGAERVAMVEMEAGLPLSFPTEDDAGVVAGVMSQLRHTLDVRDGWASKAELTETTR
ncbi:MAG: hypothetical protein ACO1Q7_00785 [Gemmatimonas sp.]